MFEKQSLEFASTMKADSAASYLEALARGLRAGYISIQSDGEFIALELSPDISVQVEAKSTGKGRASLDVELSWRVQKPAEDKKQPELTINSVPAPAQEEQPAGMYSNLEE